MSKVLHKIFSVFLAIIVLFSTVSFTVEKHFCGDILVDASVFSQVKKCASETMESTTASKPGCCKDQVDILQGQDELNLNSFEYPELGKQIFLTTFTEVYHDLFIGLPKQIIPYKDYNPPKIIRDIQLITSCYLI